MANTNDNITTKNEEGSKVKNASAANVASNNKLAVLIPQNKRETLFTVAGSLIGAGLTFGISCLVKAFTSSKKDATNTKQK